MVSVATEQWRVDPAFEKSELSTAELQKLIDAKKVDLAEVVQKGLWDGRAHVRRNSAQTLALEAKGADVTVELLPIAAKDGDPIVRQHCMRALADVKIGCDASIPALLRGLSDSVDDVHQAALASLERLISTGAPGADKLVVQALADRRPIVQAEVVELITRQAKRCTGALISALNHYNDVIRDNAVEILTMLGSSAAGPLITALKHTESRRAVGNVLARLSAIGDKERKALEAMVTGDDRELAEIAGRTLVGLAKVRDQNSQENKEHVNVPGFTEAKLEEATLAKAVDDLDPRAVILSAQDGRTVVRRNAAALLGLLAKNEEERTSAVLALIPLSKDPNNDVRRTVIHALGRLGGAHVIDVLITASADSSRGIADIARKGLQAVCKTHPQEVLSAIRPQQSTASHRAVLEGLSSIGKKGSKSLAQQLALANHPLQRRFGAQALGRNGKDATAEVGALIGLLDDMVEDVRVHASRALGAIGNNSEEVLSALYASRNDSVLSVRNEANWALNRLSGGAEPDMVIEEAGLPLPDFDTEILSASIIAKTKKLDPLRLQLLLSDGRFIVRANAATALGTLSAKSIDAVGHLALSLKDSQVSVRCAAANALGQIKMKPEISVPALCEALVGAPDDLVGAILDAVSSFGAEAVDPLLTCLSSRPERLEASVLRIIKSSPKTYIKGLTVQLLEGRTEIIKENAADIITALGLEAAAAEKSLIQALEFDSVLVRTKVIRALGRVAKPGKALTMTLRKIAETDTRISVLDAVDDAMLYLRSRKK